MIVNSWVLDKRIEKKERNKRDFEKMYDSIDGNIQWFSSGKYQIETQKHGVIDFFTANNTIILRDSKKTVKNGLKWILENLTR